MKGKNIIGFVKGKKVKSSGYAVSQGWVRRATSEMKLEQLELGGRAPSQKKRFIEKGKRISALFEQFK